MKEIRANETDFNIENRKVVGYALKFNTESNDLGGFVESIESNALDGVLENSDVLCLLNHDEKRGVLARWRKGKGSLNLSVDDIGLKYEFEAPNTALGSELLEGIKRGDISASSFAFQINEDRWQKVDENKYKRVIKSFKTIYDVSPVYYPAYDTTDVSIAKRGLDTQINNELEEAKQSLDLDEYYAKLINNIDE